MRYIRKNTSPSEFNNWKREYRTNHRQPPTFRNLDRNTVMKNNLLKALISEQFFICCYCGMRINEKNCHIEHFKPKADYRNLELNYTNLLASCNGEGILRHCGHKKRRWFDVHLTVSPLDATCEQFFRFTYDGKILPTSDVSKKRAAEETIIRLGLDIDKLNALRKVAIDHVLYLEDLTPEDIVKLIEDYKKPNKNGELPPFVSAVIFVLKQELSRIVCTLPNLFKKIPT